MSRKKNLNPTVEELTEKQKKAQERADFLGEAIEEMKRTGDIPMVPFSGIINDLFLINPAHIKVIIPKVHELYKKELKEIEKLIAKQN